MVDLERSPHAQRLGIKSVMEMFSVGPWAALALIFASIAVVAAAVTYVISSAPPTHLTISAGPVGSAFQKNALKYAEILKHNGVTLTVLPSEGSLQNLQRLADPNWNVDLGIAQAGITGSISLSQQGPQSSSSPVPNAATPGTQAATQASIAPTSQIPTQDLVSLGSISYQPLLVFYRSGHVDRLSELEGKRLAIGQQGTGARTFALALLSANGIKSTAEGGKTTFLAWDAQEAAKGLMDGQIDAAFIMSENASTDIMHSLLHDPKIELMSFKQAVAYTRRIDFLNMLTLPEGVIDFGKNIPAQDVTLLGPMVELVARKGLHPALSDLIVEAAQEVHGKAGVFQKRGEFPEPVEHAIRISEDASRYYKSGRSFFYRYLPFWIASLLSRLLVVVVPVLVVVIPAVRSIPALFRWRTQAGIYRRYHELLRVEQEFHAEPNPASREKLKARIERIEQNVNRMKVPASFADQIYGLRGHIDYVRNVVEQAATGSKPVP